MSLRRPFLEVTNATDADRDPLTYEFRVYADENLDTLVDSQTGVGEGAGGNTAWQVAAELADNTHYWWVVRATDDNGLAGDWTAASLIFINTANDTPTVAPDGSPADGAEVTTTTPLLAVDHATDADGDVLSYFFEIDTVNTFDGFELERSDELTQQAGQSTDWTTRELTDNTTYYWRVRAYDGAAYSPWHSASFFVNTANDAPGTPTIDHPGDLSEITTRQPTLAVKAALDLDLDQLAYEFELYADVDLSELVTAVEGAGTAWPVDATLDDNRTYFWRVRAVDAHGAAGEWTTLVSFFVNIANEAPIAPMLSSPVNGATVISLTPTLTVFNADDPDQDDLSYEFELYADADLAQRVSTATVVEGSLTTAWTVPSELDAADTYYWRVRADDGQLAGSWMATAVFNLRPGGLSALLTAAGTVELAWDSALNSDGDAPAGYHVYRSTAEDGSYTAINNAPVTTAGYTDSVLSAGLTYYYVVTVTDGDDAESAASQPAAVVLTDSDGDGLYDLQEDAGCTDADESDSDGDGLADGIEDADHNGTVDAGETDPCRSDSDGDGLPDGWEDSHGLDALNGSGDAGRNGDPDGDGWTNYQEYVSRTAPDDGESVPVAPTVPTVNYPADTGETDTRQPRLSINNAIDTDSQDLRYVFELYADAGLTARLAATAPDGLAQSDNTTAWQVDVLLDDNRWFYWRARALDGTSYSDWMATAAFFVNTTAEAPTIPAVSWPPDGTEVTLLQPGLEVTNAVDADMDALTYEFGLYGDEDLSVLISTKAGVVQGGSGTTAWQTDTLLDDNTDYWWVVRAVDDDGLAGAWSSPARFFVNTANDAPTAPSGRSPADGEQLATLTPLLAVAPATDANLDPLSYFFEIDRVDTFDSFELERSAELAQQAGDTTGWTTLELTDNTTYHWRVRAFDGAACSAWYNSSFFVNLTNDAPTAPVIDHPGDQSDVTSRQPTLVVKAAADADLDELVYEFEIYADAELTQWIVDANGVGPAWQVEEALADNRSYYWRARAVDAHGAAGPWSATVSFFVNSANDAPDAPVLNNPISGGTDTSLTPTLSVFNAADPDQDALNYEFELYADADLSQLVSSGRVAQDQQITSWTVPQRLDDNGIYYWRVRAEDGQLAGSWMPTAVLEIHTAGADTQYEIVTRREVSAGSTQQQAVNVASDKSPIYKTAVEVPPGALRKNCTINIGLVTNPPALSRYTRRVGRVTEFGPSGMTFSVPLVIRLPYTAAALKQARVADPSELAVYWYDTSILAWVPVAIDSIDSVNQLVSFKTSHFSMYTIGAAVAADSTAAGGSGGGGAGCFIAAAHQAESVFFIAEWPNSSICGLLGLIVLFWLRRRKKMEERCA